jgi:uncharacterized repeat protein (TIGR04076 family)
MDPIVETILKRYGEKVGYSSEDLERFGDQDPRLRHLQRLAEAAPRYSIEARVVRARHCNTGYRPGDRFVLDVDGNLISKLCPKRICVYALSQLVIPVALINERLSEGLDPNRFHFVRFVRCPDTGVECSGYGEVMMEVRVVPRESGERK